MLNEIKKSLADAIRTRRQRIKDILDGALPDLAELHQGYPFCGGDYAHDRIVSLKALRSQVGETPAGQELASAIDYAVAVGTEDALHDLRRRIQEYAEENILPDAVAALDRIGFYLACIGSEADRDDLIATSLLPGGLQQPRSSAQLYRYAFAIGLRLSQIVVNPRETADRGIDVLKGIGDFAAAVLEAQLAPSDTSVRPLDVDTATFEEICEQVVAAGHPSARGIVVIPDLPERPTGHSREIWKSLESVAGKPIAIDPVANFSTACDPLSRRYPHFVEEIHLILRAPQPLRVLLVGTPGCGKSEFARDIASALGLQSVLFSAAGAADSAFMGTSAQYTSARMSIPLQLITRRRVANPVILLDEVDKIGTGTHNGSLTDALLGFLEPVSARSLLDLALEIEVDLSRVGYIATANTLDNVPSMLRDRFLIVRMPKPKRHHAPALTEHILDAIAAERQIDRRFLPSLDQDELEVIEKQWKTGSIRQLRRMIDSTLAVRDRVLVRS